VKIHKSITRIMN